MPRDDSALENGLQQILQACLSSEGTTLPCPARWEPVPLRRGTISHNGLTWQVGLWRRPDVHPFAAPKVVANLPALPADRVQLLGHEGGLIAKALYEGYGVFLEFRLRETVH